METQNTGNCSMQCCEKLAELLFNLLTVPGTKPLLPQFENCKTAVKLYNYIDELRELLLSFSTGYFSDDIKLKGTAGGAAKNLQSNLKNLAWQMDRVANGDLSQHSDFMGELSDSYNNMVAGIARLIVEKDEQNSLLKGIAKDLSKEITYKEYVEKDLIQREEKYKSLARLDHLTNIYNRRYFYEIAFAELERMKRNKAGSCVIAMLDIDHFKRYNDQYGHVNGDHCLKFIAALLKINLRRFDVVARYGGEEFILLLPQTGTYIGRTVLERLRELIYSSIIKLPSGEDTAITVSIGFTEIKAPEIAGTDYDQILTDGVKKADNALYEAKRNNRNQVRLYNE